MTSARSSTGRSTFVILVGGLSLVSAVFSLAGPAPASNPPGQPQAPGRAQRRAPTVPFPPELPGSEIVVTDSSDQMLQAPPGLQAGVEIAKTPPEVDFMYLPGQDYEGNPWSAWGDSLFVGGKYYTSIGDHKGPDGNAFVYEYDPSTRELRLLLDLREFLGIAEGHYTPGKIHTRLDVGRDGWLYFGTHRGSPRVTRDAFHYEGDWILRLNPTTGKTEVVAHAPVEKHALPTGILDPERMIFYAGTAPGADAPSQQIEFLAYDVANRRVLHSGPLGPYRALIVSSSTGRVYFTPGEEGAYDGSPLMRYDPAAGGPPVAVDATIGLRAASSETPDGIVYAVSQGREGSGSTLYAFDVNSESVEVLGPAPVGRQSYITSLDTDPSGRFVYYVPGAHGGSATDGTPIVQFDARTRTRKVIAFLHPFYQERYGATLKGTYSVALDERGETLYITWHVSRGTRAWDSCALTVVRIPESER